MFKLLTFGSLRTMEPLGLPPSPFDMEVPASGVLVRNFEKKP